MKLAPSLIKYLGIHKELQIPGLGIFTSAGNFDPDAADDIKTDFRPDIVFEEKEVKAFSEELIDFVASDTGKMRVLIASDLDSQLKGMLDYLSSGKPYLIEGIGTLTKKPRGEGYLFTPYSGIGLKEKKSKAAANEKVKVPQTYIDTSRRRNNNKPAIIIAILSVLAIAFTIWFYLKADKQQTGTEVGQENITPSDTTSALPLQDSSVAVKTTTASSSNDYKYVLEICNRMRAEKRYAQLKKIDWPVQLETADSVTYKIFMLLPRAGADTTRVKDSLSALSGKKVFIEP
ncbi:MAG: hypothetical protein QM727_00465 [Niabella sp.]